MEYLVAGYEIIEQKPGIEGVYEAAELPGRICYHSEDKMAPGTAERFCNGLMKSNHGAPLEHNGVYLNTTSEYIADKYKRNPYSKVVSKYSDDPNVPNIYNVPTYYITTNLRVLFENGWMDDLQYWCEPTEYHERRIQVRFTVDRFTGEEFLRHRKASFNRESTRYVCFTKEKFGGGSIKFIVPVWMLDENGHIPEELHTLTDDEFRNCCAQVANSTDADVWQDFNYWSFALKASEFSYCNLVRLGWTAEKARTVLPCAINSPLIKTAFLSDWIHFFNLRAIGTTGKPHPQAQELAEPLMHDFINRGWIKIDEETNKLVLA